MSIIIILIGIALVAIIIAGNHYKYQLILKEGDVTLYWEAGTYWVSDGMNEGNAGPEFDKALDTFEWVNRVTNHDYLYDEIIIGDYISNFDKQAWLAKEQEEYNQMLKEVNGN